MCTAVLEIQCTPGSARYKILVYTPLQLGPGHAATNITGKKRRRKKRAYAHTKTDQPLGALLVWVCFSVPDSVVWF